MLIQLNTDNHVDGRHEAMREVETDLERTLARFSSQITRIEVHFRDTNADKSGASDKECTLEARVSGQDPTAVTHAAPTLSAAFHGARDKLVEALSAEPVDDGANLLILESREEADFLFSEKRDGLKLASPVIAYLDLIRAPGRAAELADHLRKEALGY